MSRPLTAAAAEAFMTRLGTDRRISNIRQVFAELMQIYYPDSLQFDTYYTVTTSGRPNTALVTDDELLGLQSDILKYVGVGTPYVSPMQPTQTPPSLSLGGRRGKARKAAKTNKKRKNHRKSRKIQGRKH